MTPALYINSSGGIEPVDPARADEVEMLGWVPASAAQAKDYFLREKYGTTGQAAIAGLESFGSMLTLGASTHLETGLGVDPEAIAAREKYNPLASGTGSTIGILAPLLATAGASGAVQGAEAGTAAARAASLTGPALLASAGKAAAKAALRELPETAPLAQRLAAKGLAAAVGGAVEGAGYEVGQLVHESALGDPNLSAESALARIGLSAATFGTLSGGGGILGQLTHEAGAALGGPAGVREKLTGWLEGIESRSAGKAAGGIQQDIKKLRQKLGGAGADAVMKDMGEMGLVDWYTTPQMTAERSQLLMDRAGATMGEVVKSADAIAAAEGEALGDLGSVVRRARVEVLKPLKADPYQKEAAKKLEALLADIGQRPALTRLEELHALRVQNDAALYGMRGTLDPYATAYRQGLHDLRSLYSDAIETGIQKSGVPLDIWKAASREYQVGATALEFAEKGIERSQGNNIFGLSSALWGGVAGTMAGGPLGGIGGTLATEAARRYGSGALYRVSKGLRGLLESEGGILANRTAEKVAAERVYSQGAHASGLSVALGGSTAPETAAALSVLAQAQRKVTEDVDSALTALIKGAPSAVGKAVAANLSRRAADAVEVHRLVSSPDLLQDVLARQTDELHGHAPNVAQAAQMASARAVAFLASKAPATTLPGLHVRAVRPGAAELAKFGRYADVVHRPLRALEHAKRGTLTPEHVASLRVVYPALYQHVQERFLEALMGAGGKTISPQSRMMLSMLTGFRLDASLSQNAIAANQAVYAHVGASMDRPVPNANAGALKQAGRTQTQSQRLEGRLGEGG